MRIPTDIMIEILKITNENYEYKKKLAKEKYTEVLDSIYMKDRVVNRTRYNCCDESERGGEFKDYIPDKYDIEDIEYEENQNRMMIEDKIDKYDEEYDNEYDGEYEDENEEECDDEYDDEPKFKNVEYKRYPREVLLILFTITIENKEYRKKIENHNKVVKCLNSRNMKYEHVTLLYGTINDYISYYLRHVRRSCIDSYKEIDDFLKKRNSAFCIY